MALEFLATTYTIPIKDHAFISSTLLDRYKLDKLNGEEYNKFLQSVAPEDATHYRFSTSFDEINIFHPGTDHEKYQVQFYKSTSKTN